MKPKFHTLMDLPKIKGMEPGTGIENEYGYVMDHRNIVGLEKTGEINRYEMIQMHADECNISLILAKASVDPTVLQQRKGIYADITEMPKSLAEFKNLEIKIMNDWNKLDTKTKEQFDNSFDKYIAEFGSESWAKAMGIETPEEVKEVIEETVKQPIKVEEGEVNE